ncbi:hypothetical protein [Lysinibacillus fusiformis]|uniref:hypothetical protein n=1 Tax=Lysinibacillus fusiformis TaxID=28031 RepID=UPI003CFCB1EF
MNVKLEFELQCLKSDLSPGNIVQLSMSPDIPGRDELINHKVIDANFEETRSGLLLTIKLENCETKELYTYVYPDILEIEMPSNFKYYLYCIDRSKLAEYEMKKSEELLNAQKDIDVYNFYLNAPTQISRILIKSRN